MCVCGGGDDTCVCEGGDDTRMVVEGNMFFWRLFGVEMLHA